MRPQFRIAIANRGEPAVRALHTFTEVGRVGAAEIRSIAIYTEADRNALFVRLADEAYCLGPAQVFDEVEQRVRHAYLDKTRLAEALRAVRADAVWVGWGFVSEDADFAALCEGLGVMFIGPPVEAMRRLSDKIEAKKIAERAGAPVAPWSGGPICSFEEATAHAARIGYPLLIKAAAGGGGRGIREVWEPAALERSIAEARQEAKQAFGDDAVFMERRIGAARHLEVQVLGDKEGTLWTLGVRECSVQRRRQKVLEESGLAIPNPAVEAQLRAHALSVCKAAGYANVGTVEFLYEQDTGALYFMEVNTRLQVEHTVTEMTTGVDLVRAQLDLALGGRLEGEAPAEQGHAIEMRLNAEDAKRGFAPSPGRVALYRPPLGPGVRVDSAVREGDVIAKEFDSMIAKIIAWAPTRAAALRRLQRALQQTDIVVEGGITNKSFLLDLVERPEIRQGRFDTGWLDGTDVSAWSNRHADIALMQAAVESYEEGLRAECAHFLETAARGRAEVDARSPRRTDLGYGGHGYSVQVGKRAPGQYRLAMEGAAAFDVQVEHVGAYERALVFEGRRHRILIGAHHGSGHSIEVDGATHRISREDGGAVRSHFPTLIVSLLVKEGQDVAAGAPMFVVESMKMESVVPAPFTGRVREIFVQRGGQVDAGEVIARIDIDADADTGESEARVNLGPSSGADVKAQPQEIFQTIEAMILGYDVTDEEADSAVIALSEFQSAVRGADQELFSGGRRVIESFCDVHALAPRLPDADAPAGVRPQDYLRAFLRSPAYSHDALPEAFMNDLRSALRLYDVNEVDSSPRCREALLRIFKSRRRLRQQETVVIAILLHWRSDVDALLSSAEDILELLDRLACITDCWSPSISDLARLVRFRLADQPLHKRGRADALAALQADLEALSREPEAPQSAARISRLVSSSEPWEGWLAAWLSCASPQARATGLEVLLRIQYRHADYATLHRECDGQAALTVARLEGPANAQCLIALASAGRNVRQDMERILAAADSAHAAGDVVIEYVYLEPADDKLKSEQIAEHLACVGRSLAKVRRLVVTCIGGAHGTAVRHRVLERRGAELQEAAFPDIHPALAERLELWRLRNFAVTTLAHSNDSILFSGVAFENPKDQRLFAFGEVWDLDTAPGSRGRFVSIPKLELVLRQCLDLVRQHCSAFPSRSRFTSNRVVLNVAPIWRHSFDVLKELAGRVASATRGLSIDYIVLRLRVAEEEGDDWSDVVVNLSIPAGAGVQIGYKAASCEPVRALTRGWAKSAEMRRLGLVHPLEIIRLLTSPGATHSDFPAGEFHEFDFDDAGSFAGVARPQGENTANLVVGVITNFTAKHPEGMSRVVILSDPSKSLGSLGEAECRRILAALDLAQERSIPIEWFAVSSGARVSMDSGTENMDWTARVLRALIQFTQAGGEVNVIVTGVNVGAQSYWNAEATMLMHTRGILVMTGESAMVLTGKQALDYSGAVSADTNAGIGGYERIMGPNGQAQYWAPDVEAACRLLFRHYDLTYVAPGERFPRRAQSADPIDRDVRGEPHRAPDQTEFLSIGDIFDCGKNADRKKPFDIRSVMRAVADLDDEPLERWAQMQDADTAVVWDVHLGGVPVCMIGVESREQTRLSVAPADGPRRWSAGTLFPKSSKKIARAINAASGNRPVVVLANLSGFDGSPESMRQLQLEYGAEIGRAIVNFNGPIVFCVLSRYHGGAFVVFSKVLNDRLEAVAVEGAHASVLGGAPAAAVVFAREVERRVNIDPRVKELSEVRGPEEPSAAAARNQRLAALREQARAEARSAVAREFDAIHTIERALAVGSIDRIVPIKTLRASLVDALVRGMTRLQ